MAFIYFSNDLRRLAERLGERLFQKRPQHNAAFLQRTVIVPSDRYKRFLQEVFAKDPQFGIAMGIQITTLSSWLASRLMESTGKSFLSYALLEARLFIFMKTLPLESLRNLSDQQCKTLCQELAHLFHKYGAQGEFLNTWLKRDGWQQTLWKAIYENADWGYSTEPFHRLLHIDQPPHLFGFSSLPSPHAQFFKKVGATLFLFSPCPLFWADLKTTKELARDGLVEENPSLLASFGKWGRRLLNELATEEMESEEDYVEPAPLHTLAVLQKSIFDLEAVEMITPLPETIRAFSAKHRRQEIEELLEEILRLLQKRKDLSPADILVLSSDLGAYLPYIHAAFQGVAGILDYSIRGIERGRDSPLAQGVHALFNLVEEKWSMEALLALCAHPLFAEKKGWKKGDLVLIEKWLKGAGLTWGYDREQRETILQSKSSLAEAGTLCFALDRLLFGLTSTAPKAAPSPSPQVPWSETELLNGFLETMEGLARDLSPMVENKKKPLKEWVDVVSSLIDCYFSNEDDPWITDELLLLKKGCQTWEEPFFTWQDLKKICQELFAKPTSGYRTNNLQSVQFDVLEEGTILPKKVIMLIGIQDGAFPRSEVETSLDQLETKPPSKGEIDRFLFLEALLKAQEFFVLSFLHTCPEKKIELSPSLVVQEVQNALERCKGKLEIRVLPERDFTIEALSIAPYFSSSRFKAANAFYQRKERSHHLLREWQEATAFSLKIPIEEGEIDLGDLQLLLRDPMEFYFKKGLGLKLDWVDEQAFYPEEMFVQTAAKKRVIERSLKSSLDVAIDEYQRDKGLPFGLFRDVALGELEEEFHEMTEQCEQHGIKAQELRDITLGKEIAPWTIDLGEGKMVTLKGTIKQVSKEGLVDFYKESPVSGNWLKRWCDLLIMKGHPELQSIPVRLIVVESKKKTEDTIGDIDPVLEMRKLLLYHAVAKKHASPFLPSWAEMLFKRDLQALEKAFQENLFLPRYVKWLFKRDGTPDPAVLCDTWSLFLQETFSSTFLGDWSAKV